jgi:glutamine synthetase
MKTIKDNEVLFIDLRFNRYQGQGTARLRARKAFEDDKFEWGTRFDGSSIAGWKGIERRTCCCCPTRHGAHGSVSRREHADS